MSLLNRIPVLSRLSVHNKVSVTMVVIFMLVIGTVTAYTVEREKERILDIGEQITKDMTTFYFDGLNTMMLTGTMDQRTILRKKVLRRPNVIDARVIRGEPVKKQFGAGYPEEQPSDQLDFKALQGNEIVHVDNGKKGRVITALTPFQATEDTNGVNCLACHNVPSGAVNGAIRVSYSMADMDAAAASDMKAGVAANVILLFIGVILANLLLRTWISNPLSNLMGVVTRLAEGDTAARVAVSGHDEIGRLGQAFNTMADNIQASSERERLQTIREREAADELKNKVHILLDVVNKASRGDLTGKVTFSGDDAIGELGKGLQRMVDNLRQMIEEKQHSVEDLNKKVDIILQTVKRASNGDLTGKIAISGDDAIAQLASGVQAMIDSLNLLVSQVQHSGIQVTSSATEIAATAKEQEATVSEQAATVNQIVTTATEISSTTKELVNTMDEVAEVADGTASSASEGHSALAHMEETMRQVVEASSTIAAKLEVLNEKAGNINSVVTTITKVADQTNLLSLNAAIEAEKAGEYGVGFSVVATEIRRLADQTAVATLDIEQMVKEMQSAVSAGVMSVDKFSREVRQSVDDVRMIGTQLAQIIEQVQALSPRFESVQQGMHFQSEGAEQIKQAMVQLSESAQQTVESLRQSNTAIDRLNDAAHGLQNGVSKFKVIS
jgi:methyl-accepting chemotaxis protein